MTLKHIEDDGDLSVLVDDKGSVLLVCQHGHQWVGTSFKAAEDAHGAAREHLARALRASPARMVGMHGLNIDRLE